MCLSTAYMNEKQEDNIVAKYISSIRIEDEKITMVDVMGFETKVDGKISEIDLTNGVVMLSAN